MNKCETVKTNKNIFRLFVEGAHVVFMNNVCMRFKHFSSEWESARDYQYGDWPEVPCRCVGHSDSHQRKRIALAKDHSFSMLL